MEEFTDASDADTVAGGVANSLLVQDQNQKIITIAGNSLENWCFIIEDLGSEVKRSAC